METLCTCVKRNGSQCGKRAVNGLCGYHTKVEAKRTERAERKKKQKNFYEFHLRVGLKSVREDPDFNLYVEDQITYRLLDRNYITNAQRLRLLRILALEQPRVLKRMHTPTNLGNIAQDYHNVFRKVVVDTVNVQIEKLLQVPVPAEQNTLEEIRPLFNEASSTMDMLKFCCTTRERNEGDRMYKRILDGVWATIKRSEYKDELCKRLVEEITDSSLTCNEGHFARLCNVLVGFDDAFTPVIPKSDVLQQQMSEIAALDIAVPIKKMRARKILRDLEIPSIEHSAWLDAF